MSDPTVTFLRNFNRWRRGEDDQQPPSGLKVGKAIDEACDKIESLQQQLHAAREQCHKLRLERMAADRAYADICHKMELREAGK